jgi:hypothetical protein
MRKLAVKLTAFDLLHWVNEHTVSNDIFEQAIVRNTLINLLDLYDHWCKDETTCDVCQRPEGAFVRNRESELEYHAEAIFESNRKFAELKTRLDKTNFDISSLYSAFITPESDTVIRAVAHRGVISDFGEMHYTRRGSVATLGSNHPVVIQGEEFGKTAFDGSLTLTVFLDTDHLSESWTVENTLAANELVTFTSDSLSSMRVGDIEIPTNVERVEEEVFALGGILEDERDIVRLERHKVINATRSHPVLGRLANGDDVWQIVSDGAGRTINDAMRTILASKGDPSLTTEEAIKLASIVFSKRGIKQYV